MLQIVITPDDSFAGRNLTRFGVGERLALSVVDTTNPRATVPAIRWSASAGGTLTAGAGNAASFVCADLAATVTVRAEYARPQRNASPRPATFAVVAPGAHMIREPGTPLYHERGRCTAGFSGLTFFTPADVSFAGMVFREMETTAHANGYFAGFDGTRHPPSDRWLSVGSGNASTGCQLSVPDSIIMAPDDARHITLGPPFDNGRFDWNIPWKYKVGNGPERLLVTAVQTAISEPSGRCSIRKLDCGPFATMPGDPNSDL